MTHTDEPGLEIHIFGFGWRVNLRLEPNLRRRIRPAEFELPLDGGRGTRTATVPVDYGVATDDGRDGSRDGGRVPHDWQRWFVKIYRCDHAADASALLEYLLDQARDIQQANAALGGAARTPFSPPWATVPVHIVRGDLQQANFDDTITTQLSIPVGVPQPTGWPRLSWPTWFVSGDEEAERTVLAIAPWVEQITWELDGARRPGVQHLAGFRNMARGLDTLHNLGIVHGDITPNNVCRYDVQSDHGFIHGFVLVDVDAAARLSSPPRVQRTIPQFAHRSMRAWMECQAELPADAVPDRGTLLANDRFGFVLVVLSALAGEQWVRNVLLRSDSHPDRQRIADDPDRVVEALDRLWHEEPLRAHRRGPGLDGDGESARRWASFIDVLTEPFGHQIEASDWSATRWLERLIDAGRAKPKLPMVASPGEIRRLSGRVERIRRDVRAQATTNPVQMVLGYRAVEVAAQRVAWARARLMLALTVVAFVVLDVVIVLSRFVFGK